MNTTHLENLILNYLDGNGHQSLIDLSNAYIMNEFGETCIADVEKALSTLEEQGFIYKTKTGLWAS